MKTGSQPKPRSTRAHRARPVDSVAAAAAPPKKPRGPARPSFSIVGIGASAGGLDAFTQLLKHLPVDTGMGFVLVQHLDPVHESVLTQLLSRATAMPVREVTDALRVEPNHVYVIPPNVRMEISRGVLRLRPRDETGRGAHHSIDLFFESLARDRRAQAIGVVLSGTASDGTLGLEAIKAGGGITFAQDHSAKFDSMPHSAIAAGCVDFVLSLANIAREVARIAKHPFVAGTKTPSAPPAPNAAGEGAPRAGPAAGVPTDGIKNILLLLRRHCGVDFSLYKASTIQRRVTRRMVLTKHHQPGAYADFLEGNVKELDALYSDLLIGVTSFFRNAEAFAALQHRIFPQLLAHARPDEALRVWVPGC
ncbi:MAG: hypothetical protein QG637_696, partial [Chloroflexota bacterium]|nr:hypothetical protein [Chloroflexota bacterium]